VSLEVLKDLLGLIGAIVLIVPFFRDFMQRRFRDQLSDLARTFPVFGRKLGTMLAAHKSEGEKASNTDLAFMLIGIGLLIASFAVSLYISAHGAA